MNLSKLWPRAKKAPATMTIKVSSRSVVKDKRPTLNGPRELPDNLPECEQLDEELLRDSIRLECQIGIVRGKSQAEGEYADPNWYHKANAALKYLRHDRQRLLVHMKQLRTAARRTDPHWQGRDQALIRALREELPEGRFEQIVEEIEMNIEAGIPQ
ncbi:hypothetical protein [Pseudomonas sp. MF7453]|uniref:hypothetical protein n=1 Tax=Pseudomonas sp. MF7453 TaxID=2797539 RepID=UPI0018E81F38|nr:hypothetical protein [Pseudomonas sp. MF7453]MBJ2221040.1 hypothetical protein [Pseudomonas sp. MF7453]